MIDLKYPALLDLFREHLDPKRSESASFLIWYLQNYYRLDALEAVDAVCDNRGDKGIDGIFVNDNNRTITVFQSRILQQSDRSIGDAPLREFAGTLSQLQTADSIEHLRSSAGHAQVASLIGRLNLPEKIQTHDVRGEFVCNAEVDANATAFLQGAPEITFIGRSALENTYISAERDQPVHTPVSFDIVGFPVAEYIVDATTRAILAPIKAVELVTMKGIADQAIFMFNVRGPLGRTQVNRDIANSIKDPASHKLFPLFHNGITVVAQQMESDQEHITIRDYFVVNGCQSLTSLFNSAGVLTDELRVVVKFIQMNPRSDLAAMITQRANNQNGVRPRDFKSNDKIQVRLQNEFNRDYAGDFAFEIKRGETLSAVDRISNEEAGLYLMAFDLKQPWATHRKYEVFEDKHGDLFGRPEVTADRILLCHVIIGAIAETRAEIENKLFARYALTKYMLLYITRQILERDTLAADVLAKPEIFVRSAERRKKLNDCITKIVRDVIVDLNDEIKEYGDDFDYRDKLRDEEWVRKLSATISAGFQKQVNRGRVPSFSEEWSACMAQEAEPR